MVERRNEQQSQKRSQKTAPPKNILDHFLQGNASCNAFATRPDAPKCLISGLLDKNFSPISLACPSVTCSARHAAKLFTILPFKESVIPVMYPKHRPFEK